MLTAPRRSVGTGVTAVYVTALTRPSSPRSTSMFQLLSMVGATEARPSGIVMRRAVVGEFSQPWENEKVSTPWSPAASSSGLTPTWALAMAGTARARVAPPRTPRAARLRRRVRVLRDMRDLLVLEVRARHDGASPRKG